MSRWQLQLADRALYATLLRFDQLDQAIPDTILKIRSPKEIAQEENRIVQAHNLYNGNLNLAIRGLEIDGRYIWKVWKKHNLRAIGGRGGRPRKDGKPIVYAAERTDEILKAYNLYNGNSGLAGRMLSISPNTIRYVWKKYSLKATGKKPLVQKIA